MRAHTGIVVVTLRVDGRAIGVAKHAAIRYRDRIRPGLGVRDIADELERVVAACGSVGPQPEWVSEPHGGWPEPPECWLLIGDCAAMPVKRDERELIAVTCIARGVPSAGALARRAERRAERSVVRTMKRQEQGAKPGDRRHGRRPIREFGGAA